MQRLCRFTAALSRLSVRGVKAVLIAMVIVMTVLVILQVLLRYLFSAALSWSEEIARYLMIWVSFLGAGLALEQGVHIGVEALVMRLPARHRRRVALAGKALILAFLLVLAVGGIELAWFVRNQSSPALFLSMSWAYGAAAAGGIFMAIVMLHALVAELAAGRPDAEKGGAA